MSLIGHRLTSLAVIPTSHINGIAAITLTTLQYTARSIRLWLSIQLENTHYDSGFGPRKCCCSSELHFYRLQRGLFPCEAPA